MLGFGLKDARELSSLSRIAAISAIAAGGAFCIRLLLLSQKPPVILAITSAAFAAIYLALLLRAGNLGSDERELTRRYWGRALSLLQPR